MKLLRALAFLEGISLLLLFFVAMPLKYLFNKPEAVQIIGMAHGVLFIAFAIWLLVIGLRKKWPWLVMAICLFSAFVPFGTFWADKRYFRPELNQ